MYDFEELNPPYVINGSLAKLTGVYEEFLQEKCVLITSFGEYDLYKVLQGR